MNQVEDVYNGLNQLTAEYQSHTGAVNLATSAVVRYTYTEMAGGVNNSRLTSMTYPNGRTLSYSYAGPLDDAISRLSSISDSSGTLEQYEYLGLATVVDLFHPETGVRTTYIKKNNEPVGDAGDQYTGLDRFGRVVDQLTRLGNGHNVLDDFQYTYDRDSNVTAKNNLLNSAFNETYGYDSLNQLTTFARASGHTQLWTLDAQGNFTSVSTDGTPVARTNNAQNQVTSAGANALTFDANGNMTTDETGRTFVYDAWNRLIGVKAPGGATLISYSYDGLNRRITENRSGTVTDLYYSAQWQVVEERVGGVAKFQYVWSPVYVDAMILRDQLNSDGSLNQRLWAVHDADWNVTALVDNSGHVVERFAYDPYGVASVFAPNWTPRASSNFGWNYLHQGGRFEAVSGLYYFRNRDYSPTLGRWTRVDPLKLATGSNLYEYAGDDPVSATDATGLYTCCTSLKQGWQVKGDASEAACVNRVMLNGWLNLPVPTGPVPRNPVTPAPSTAALATAKAVCGALYCVGAYKPTVMVTKGRLIYTLGACKISQYTCKNNDLLYDDPDPIIGYGGLRTPVGRKTPVELGEWF